PLLHRRSPRAARDEGRARGAARSLCIDRPRRRARACGDDDAAGLPSPPSSACSPGGRCDVTATRRTAMRFGIGLDFRNPAPWRRPWAEVYERTLEQARLAEELGFDSVWVTEHHFVDDGYLPAV